MTLHLTTRTERLNVYRYGTVHREDLLRLSEGAMRKLKYFLEALFGDDSVRFAHDLHSGVASIVVKTYRRTSEECIPITVREVTGAVVAPLHAIE